uniref:Uncharacterized protein n=1 Tax=Arundo donax TaxID=35708 RepID=A0A0A9HRG9_ARUDO
MSTMQAMKCTEITSRYPMADCTDRSVMLALLFHFMHPLLQTLQSLFPCIGFFFNDYNLSAQAISTNKTFSFWAKVPQKLQLSTQQGA